MARWSATGSGPDRAPNRWRSMPPGRPTPRTRSRWCWPRPVVLGPQSPCAAPAPWLELGGHTRAERCDVRAGLLFAARLFGWRFLGGGRECVGLTASPAANADCLDGLGGVVL